MTEELFFGRDACREWRFQKLPGTGTGTAVPVRFRAAEMRKKRFRFGS